MSDRSHYILYLLLTLILLGAIQTVAQEQTESPTPPAVATTEASPTATPTLTNTPTSTNTTLPTSTHTFTPEATSTENIIVTEATPESTELVPPTDEITATTSGQMEVTAEVTDAVSSEITDEAEVLPVESSATPPAPESEPSLVAIVSDPFIASTNPDWTVGTGWQIVPSEGNYALQGTGNTDFVSYAPQTLSDLAVEAIVQSRQVTAELHLRQTATESYRLSLSPDGNVVVYRNDVVLATATVAGSGNNQWRHMRFSVFGHTLRGAIDGVEVIVTTDAQPLPEGSVAFSGSIDRSNSNQKLLIDNVRIWIPEIEDVTTPTPENREPTADFAYNCTGLVCTFDGSASSDPDGTITGYSWDFGDGTYGDTAIVEHIFGTTGTYDVNLIVADDEQDNGTITKSVAISELPDNPLDLLFTEDFEAQYIDWDIGTGWFYAPEEFGTALAVADSAALTTLNQVMSEDVAIETDLRIYEGVATFYLQQESFGGYHVTVNKTGQLDIFRESDLLNSSTSRQWNVTEWNNIRIETNQSFLRVWINDTEVASVQDPQPLSAGKIALQGDENGVYFIDNFKVFTPATEAIPQPFRNLPAQVAPAHPPEGPIDNIQDDPFSIQQLIEPTIGINTFGYGQLRYNSTLGAYYQELWLADPNDPLYVRENLTDTDALSETQPDLSFDGNTIAYVHTNVSTIYVRYRNENFAIEHTLVTNATNPDWAPDGRLAFSRYANGQRDIYIREVNGTEWQLTNDSASDYNPSWSPDGSALTYSTYDINTSSESYNIGAVVVSAGATPFVFDRNNTWDYYPKWSPISNTIVYTSFDSGLSNNDYYTVNATINGLTITLTAGSQITNDAGTIREIDGAWSPDGTQIAYRPSNQYYYYTVPSSGGTGTLLSTTFVNVSSDFDWKNDFPLPTDSNCADLQIDLLPKYNYPEYVIQEMEDMGITNTGGIRALRGPTINARKDYFFSWGLPIKVYARTTFPQAGFSDQVWYQVGSTSGSSPVGWIPVRTEDWSYLAGDDPCISNVTTISGSTSVSFYYDRDDAANYAIEHSYQNNSLVDPLSGGRVTRRLTNNQSGLLIPFANFTYSNITGNPSATGSAVFISEGIWAGGIPMSLGSTSTCDVITVTEAGWCWKSNTDPSNPWDKHEQIVAFFTNAQAPTTVNGYNVTNTQLSGSSSGIQLTGFSNTINSTYFSGNRDGDPPNNNDTFNTPDMDTDFINSIPTLRQGVVSNTSILDSLVYPNLAGVKMGDYILLDPFNTGGGAHGVLVVGWGTITNCGTAIGTRYTISNFTLSRTSSNTVPFVADFTRAQSPVPRPFYCTMYNDQQSPVQGFFNRHDWRFYTIANFISRTKSQLYIDPSWQWTANDG